MSGILEESHKALSNNCPNFRSTLPDIRALTGKLVPLLGPIVSHLTFNEFSVDSSFHSSMRSANFAHDHFMERLDLESLFTDIPLNQVFDICIDELFTETDIVENLDPNYLSELNF